MAIFHVFKKFVFSPEDESQSPQAGNCSTASVYITLHGWLTTNMFSPGRSMDRARERERNGYRTDTERYRTHTEREWIWNRYGTVTDQKNEKKKTFSRTQTGEHVL